MIKRENEANEKSQMFVHERFEMTWKQQQHNTIHTYMNSYDEMRIKIRKEKQSKNWQNGDDSKEMSE